MVRYETEARHEESGPGGALPRWRRRVVRTVVVYSLVVVIAQALLLVGVAAAGLVGEWPTTDMAGVRNFRVVDDQTWAGGQPDGDSYQELAARGVRLVVDLRTGSRDDPREDEPARSPHQRAARRPSSGLEPAEIPAVKVTFKRPLRFGPTTAICSYWLDNTRRLCDGLNVQPAPGLTHRPVGVGCPMVRPVVLALLCWSAVSVPATVILGRIMRRSSKTPTAPTLDPTTAAERDELAAAETATKDLEPTSL